MKKIILTILILCVLGTSTNFIKKAQAVDEGADAVDLGLGVTTFYAYWHPAFDGFFDSMETSNGLSIGPVISLTILKKVYLIFSYIFNFDYNTKYTVKGNDPTYGDFSADIKNKIKIENYDLILGYKLSKQLSIFAGLKHLNYAEKGDQAQGK